MSSSRFTPVNAGDAGGHKDPHRDPPETIPAPGPGRPRGFRGRFGEDVYSAEVAATVEEIRGVDFVIDVQLQSEGVPQGEIMSVPAGAIVAAGEITVECELAREQPCLVL